MAMHSSPEKKTFQEKDQLKFTILFGHLVLSSMNATPRSSRSTSQLAWMDGWIVFFISLIMMRWLETDTGDQRNFKSSCQNVFVDHLILELPFTAVHCMLPKLCEVNIAFPNEMVF